MNSAKTAIMVDSGCDISQEFIEQYLQSMREQKQGTADAEDSV